VTEKFWGGAGYSLLAPVGPLTTIDDGRPAASKERNMNAALRPLVGVLFVALFVAGGCTAQEKCKVEGVIKDKAGPGISSVTVTIKSSLGTGSGSTDKQGKYSVTVLCTEQSKHTVTPTKAGYTFQPTSRPWDKYTGGPSFTGVKQPK
jgi:hypothetical protein